MGWFKKEQKPPPEDDLQKRLAQMDARTAYAMALANEVLDALPKSQQDEILNEVKGIVAGHMDELAPEVIPEKYHAAFRNELSRLFQLNLKAFRPPQSN